MGLTAFSLLIVASAFQARSETLTALSSGIRQPKPELDGPRGDRPRRPHHADGRHAPHLRDRAADRQAVAARTGARHRALLPLGGRQADRAPRVRAGGRCRMRFPQRDRPVSEGSEGGPDAGSESQRRTARHLGDGRPGPVLPHRSRARAGPAPSPAASGYAPGEEQRDHADDGQDRERRAQAGDLRLLVLGEDVVLDVRRDPGLLQLRLGVAVRDERGAGGEAARWPGPSSAGARWGSARSRPGTRS